MGVRCVLFAHERTIRRGLAPVTARRSHARRRLVSSSMAAAGEHEQTLTPQRTTLISIAAATLLVGLKLGVGLATGSLGLISAGVESSGDVIAAVLTFFAVRLGRRPADREHP